VEQQKAEVEELDFTPSEVEKAFGLDVAHLVIFKSLEPDAPHEQWTPVKAEDVPSWIKFDPVVLGAMVNGELAQIGYDPYWYRAVKTEELTQ